MSGGTNGLSWIEVVVGEAWKMGMGKGKGGDAIDRYESGCLGP